MRNGTFKSVDPLRDAYLKLSMSELPPQFKDLFAYLVKDGLSKQVK